MDRFTWPCRADLAPAGRRLLAAGLLMLCATAEAQFAMVPTPLPPHEPPVSDAPDDATYRQDAAQHIYRSYPMQVRRGKLPPLLYAVSVIAVTVDADGNIVSTDVRREPAHAKEVVAWILGLLQRAQPLPKPTTTGQATYLDTWLIDERGRFQLDTLTEGQRDQ